MPDRLTRMTRQHEAALTRAESSYDPFRIIDACKDAFADFELSGYPNGWQRWERASRDANMLLLRENS